MTRIKCLTMTLNSNTIDIFYVTENKPENYEKVLKHLML